MIEKKELPEDIEFEGEDFAEKCLHEFDEAIAKIEAEYAVTSKSA